MHIKYLKQCQTEKKHSTNVCFHPSTQCIKRQMCSICLDLKLLTAYQGKTESNISVFEIWFLDRLYYLLSAGPQASSQPYSTRTFCGGCQASALQQAPQWLPLPPKG